MIKVDVISGFLGAGKTTLIKKIFETILKEEKVVLIENEFGEIGIDGSFLKESGIQIKEINAGCICCSLVGDFETSMKEVRVLSGLVISFKAYSFPRRQKLPVTLLLSLILSKHPLGQIIQTNSFIYLTLILISKFDPFKTLSFLSVIKIISLGIRLK